MRDLHAFQGFINRGNVNDLTVPVLVATAFPNVLISALVSGVLIVRQMNLLVARPTSNAGRAKPAICLDAIRCPYFTAWL